MIIPAVKAANKSTEPIAPNHDSSTKSIDKEIAISAIGKSTEKTPANLSGTPKSLPERLEPSRSNSFASPATPKTPANRSLISSSADSIFNRLPKVSRLLQTASDHILRSPLLTHFVPFDQAYGSAEKLKLGSELILNISQIRKMEPRLVSARREQDEQRRPHSRLCQKLNLKP